MNDLSAPVGSSGHVEAERELTIFDVLTVLARHKKLIIWFPVIVAFLAAGISLLMPNVYRANAKLLPPQQAQSGAAALLSQFGASAGAGVGIAGLKNPNDLYVGMLKSRTVADRLVGRFDLKKVYETESPEKARKLLGDRTFVTAGKDGLISIEVEDEGQQRVASIANAYVEELGRLTKVLAVTEASKRRVFFEQQLELAKDNLAKAEVALKNALDNRGVVSVDVESRAMVEMMGRLRAQISANEIQLSSMNAFVTSNNPEHKRVQEELNSLRTELSKLENGRGGPIAAGQTGKIGLENIKILRDVKYHQMLYDLLARQYEASRLDEAKDPALVQVLDPAVVPEKKFKPKRLIIVLGAFMAGLFGAAFIIFVIEARRRLMAAGNRPRPLPR